GDNGWYRSDVTVTWTIHDLESDIKSSTGCSPTTLTADTTGITLTCMAVNTAGLSASASVTVKLDKTPPSASAVASPPPNVNGWNNTNVTVTFKGTDSVSGLANCSLPVILSANGKNQSQP